MANQDLTRRHLLGGMAAVGGSLFGIEAYAQTPAPDAAAVAAAASAASKNLPGSPDDILIGQSTHFTGPVAHTSINPARGVDLAIAEFNAKGGLRGRKVRLIKMDDAYTPKRCVENVRSLIDDHNVVALFGLASTGNVGAVLPVLEEKKVPLICTYTGSPAVRAKLHRYHFTGTASYRDEVQKMVVNLTLTQRRNIAILYQNSPFGKLMLPVMEEVIKEQGATVIAAKSLEINGSDSEAQVKSLVDLKPQGVLIMSFGPSVVSSVRAVRNLIGVPTYMIYNATTGGVVDTLGDDSRGMAVSQILPYPWRQTTAITRDFNTIMTKAELAPDYEHFLGYLNMRVLLEGLKRVKRKVTSESIVTAMESIGKFDMGGFPLHFSPEHHHGSNFVEITIVGPNRRYMR